MCSILNVSSNMQRILLVGGVLFSGLFAVQTTFSAETVSVSLSVDQPVFGPGFAPEFSAVINGDVNEVVWDFGDGSSATNQNPVRHTFPAVGGYVVRITASNASESASDELYVTQEEGAVFVCLSGSHQAPYATWATAATNIQEAVDVALWGGTVWVSNGVYASGGRPAAGCGLTNRVCVEKRLVLRSLEGAEHTVIAGRWHNAEEAPCGPAAVRGIWLGEGAVLDGFSVIDGSTFEAEESFSLDSCAGGVMACGEAAVSNCWVSGCYAGLYGGGGYGCSWAACRVENNIASFGGGVADAEMSESVLAGNEAYTSGGGAYGGVLSQCVFEGNVAWWDGGGAASAGLLACTVLDNVAFELGGGASSCSGEGCTFASNLAATDGGGAYGGLFANTVFDGNETENGNGGGFAGATEGDGLKACMMVNNVASRFGGGCYRADLSDCLVSGNEAENGAGCYVPADSPCVIRRCRLLANRARIDAGGVYGGTLFSCVLAGNSAGDTAGGAYGTTLESCSVQGNSSGKRAGGSYGGEAYNSILYYNSAPIDADVSETLCSRCCSPVAGSVVVPPLTTGFFEPRLLPGSPCRGAGVTRDWMTEAEGLDMDGENRMMGAGTEIGADEAVSLPATGPLSVTIFAEASIVAAGFAQTLRAEVAGNTAVLNWNFGDGSGVINLNPLTHAFASPGVYLIQATATNLDGSASATVSVTVVTGNAFVSTKGSHTYPFASWSTAATNVQDAVDAVPWGGVVNISDGAYATGGRPSSGSTLMNRVCLERPVTLRSSNGPSFVTLRGRWNSPEEAAGPDAVRGVCLDHPQARLEGVRVENGATELFGDQYGGGVFCRYAESVVSNCVVRGCVAASDGGGLYGGTAYDSTLSDNQADAGGGAAAATLKRCVLFGNTAVWYGGGAFGGSLVNCLVHNNDAGTAGGVAEAMLFNCTVVANSASERCGGMNACTAANSIIWGNSAPLASNTLASACLFSLTAPLPTGDDDRGGNLEGPPRFVSASRRNYRLRSPSPGLDGGTNMPSVIGTLDLDGNYRYVNDIVDLGAYEYVLGESFAELGTPINWLDDYYAGPDWDAAEMDDSDGDGYPAWAEYIALTDPTSPASCFSVTQVTVNHSVVAVSFDTSLGRAYTVQHLVLQPFPVWTDVSAPMSGTGGQMTVEVPAYGNGAFYRANVRLP